MAKEKMLGAIFEKAAGFLKKGKPYSKEEYDRLKREEKLLRHANAYARNAGINAPGEEERIQERHEARAEVKDQLREMKGQAEAEAYEMNEQLNQPASEGGEERKDDSFKV